MEEEGSFSSWLGLSNYIPTWFVAYTTPLQGVKNCKAEFEKQLQLGWSLQDVMPITLGSFSKGAIRNNHIEFLRYCYNLKLHNDPIGFELSDLDKDVSLLVECKEAQINGYSALGAAIIAKDILTMVNKCIQVPVKSRFILDLVKRGFVLTGKDRELLALELYTNIPGEQKQKMTLLLQDNNGYFSVFPHDVRKLLMHYMICLFKEEEPLFAVLHSTL
jgi:hypothetical protein